MAHYKVGDKLFSQEEYDEDILHRWAFALFIIGALLVGSIVMTWLPVEWSKYVRFPIVVLAGSIMGGVAAYFSQFIRKLTGWIVVLAVFGGIGYGVWELL